MVAPLKAAAGDSPLPNPSTARSEPAPSASSGQALTRSVPKGQALPLEMTPRGVPISLRPYFQEYNLEDVDPEQDAFTVIERTLSWGMRRELRWLFRRYPQAQVAEVVRFSGWWLIPRRRFYFWLNVLGITEYRKSEYQRLWPH